jgi:hypothetical protein
LFVAGGTFDRKDTKDTPHYALRDCWKFDLKTKNWEIIPQFGNVSVNFFLFEITERTF